MRWPSSAVHDAPPSQETASVPDTWRWPSSAPAAAYPGEEYRGELLEPPAPAIEEEWLWPGAVSGSAVESPRAIEHYSAAWVAPALPAPDGGAMGWAAPEAIITSDAEPSWAALPAPEPETPQLSKPSRDRRLYGSGAANSATLDRGGTSG